jgi:hypothetical protein
VTYIEHSGQQVIILLVCRIDFFSLGKLVTVRVYVDHGYIACFFIQMSHLETSDLVQKQNKNTTSFPLVLEIDHYLKQVYI